MANQRQNIVTALIALLKTLPYRLQIGVYDRRDIINEPFSSDELPCINVVDGKVAIEKLNSMDKHTLPLDITLFQSGIISAVQTRENINSISTLLAANYTLSGTAVDTVVLAAEIIDEQYGDAIITGNLTVETQYHTEPGQL